MIAGLWLSVQALAGVSAVPAAVARDSVPGSELTVYLLTFEPGDLIWERFGHNAVWVRDRTAGTDVAYDYGRFSFGRTKADLLRFFGRFAKGDLNYSMGYAPTDAVVEGYTRLGRSIWVQELDLPPGTRLALRDFLEWNKTEEHKYYQYNYYDDNCSTRIRDAIDRLIGGQIKAWADTLRTPWSYRDHTRRTTQSDPLMYTLLDIGLGQPTDRPISAWEEMFLPISLRPYLNRITIRDPDGRVHPLVKMERHLVDSDRFSVPDRPANWIGRYLALGVLAGGFLALLGWLGGRTSGWRLGFAMAGGMWSLVAGVGGLVLAALWAFTTHRFSYWNENLFHMNVASLVVAWAIPRGVVGVDPERRARVLRAAAVVLGLSALGLVVKVLPWFGQANLDLIALFLPVHLGLFAGLRLCRK